ncbi:MAG: penicillin-binding protein, partial [Deltaproteobacteria bacterium]|nr:penicillin-binding protein [Deltaproteobacteria bacterium]
PTPPDSLSSSPPAAGLPRIHNGLPRFDQIRDGKFMEERDRYKVTYTVDPVLQTAVEDLFRSHRPPFGVFVALEPKTGKILALADYSQSVEERAIWQRATYPAASIFKLVTAAGALEKGLLRYDSPLPFRGNPYRLDSRKLLARSKNERQTNFDEALGKSNNVVFGRVAAQILGPQALREYSEAFQFNRAIRFDFSLDMSRASVPEELYEVARCGAGFGEVTLNPLHAALIGAAIANGGVMMRPYLIEGIYDPQGERIYRPQPEVWARPISAPTARNLGRMMLRTVEDGTASRVFRRFGKDLLKKISVCGKTGSLSGDNPPGLYEWFVGFAPAAAPQIAFAAMAINHQNLKSKSTYVAQEALRTFFREQID